MKKKVFIRTLWIILASLLVSFITVAWVSGNWNVFGWEAHLVETGKFVGGAVLVVLFIVFRKQLKAD
jgi:hypothetical protein